MTPGEPFPPVHHTAWRLVFFAGLIPATVGLSILATALYSSTIGFTSPWLSPMGAESFSAETIGKTLPSLTALWRLTVHLGGANLTMSGTTMSWVARTALRRGQAWAVPFLWVLTLWVGVNDAVALVIYRLSTGTGVPIAIVPTILGAVGLWRHMKERAAVQTRA